MPDEPEDTDAVDFQWAWRGSGAAVSDARQGPGNREPAADGYRWLATKRHL